MGLTQSSAGLMRSMSPYAAESPTRDFLGGSMMYGSTPRAFWGELFGEYYFLRTSPNVPQSLLQSLQSATKALTRAFARPDHVDAHNVSMMFRVVVSFASEYSESMEREFVQGQSAILSDSSSGNGFQITEQHVCGGVMLLADVVNAFISSGAGRDRIYLVLGASARRERAGGDGHLLAGGEAVARSTVEALCGILVTVDRSPIERMIPVKQLITHALVTVLSARLYADRSITSESVAFLPFFELWGRKNSNAHNLVQTLLRNAAVTNSADTLYEQNSPSSSGPATPTSWSSAVVDINNYMGISQTVPASSSQSFGRFLRRKSQRNSFRPQQTMTESASSLRSDPGLWINSPRTGRTPIGGSRTGTRPQLAKSSISMLVVLLFGSDQERSELFTAAVLEMSESEDKRHEVFEVAIKWIGDDRGILLTYLLLQKCNAFRRMAPGLLLDGVDSCPLFDVLKLITNERGSNEPPEVVFVPLILLELLTEDPEMLQFLEEVKVPTPCLCDNLSLCSPEEAMSCSEDEDRSSVPLGIVVVLAAVSSARRKRTDTFLLTLSVTIIANISRTALRVVDHASWSIITLLDSLSSQYRSYSVQEPSSDTEDEEGTSGTWHEDTDDMTVVLGTMVEAVAALVLGTARVHESIYVKNEHVLLGLLKIRESIFDVDSGLTLMIAKNEKASAECQAACKRLFQLLDEAKAQLSERSLEDEELLIQLREKLNLGKLHEQLEMEDLNGPEFRYVEERRALDFFAPYVWSIERGVSLDPPDPTMRFLAITPPTIRETLSSSVKSPLAP